MNEILFSIFETSLVSFLIFKAYSSFISSFDAHYLSGSSFGYKASKRILIMLFLLSVTVLGLLCIYPELPKTYFGMLYGEKTEGQIEKGKTRAYYNRNTFPSPRRNENYVTYEISYGKNSFISSEGLKRYKKGDVVQVIYDPETFEADIADGRQYTWLVRALFPVLGFFFPLLAWWKERSYKIINDIR